MGMQTIQIERSRICRQIETTRTCCLHEQLRYHHGQEPARSGAGHVIVVHRIHGWVVPGHSWYVRKATCRILQASASYPGEVPSLLG